MAPGLDKLNRAGLGAQSFGTRKTTGMSAQVTKNLANSSPATKSSLFSFKGSRMANFVPGRNVSENMYKYNYQNKRASLNGGAQRTFAPRSAGHVHSTNMNNIGTVQYNNTSYQNGMATANLLLGGMQLLNQFGVFDGVSSSGSSSLGDKLSSVFSGIGGGGAAGSAISGSISSMESASDSASLRGAISSAETQLNTMNGMTQYLTTAAEEAKGQIGGLETAVDKGETTVKENKQKFSNAKNTVTARTSNRDNKQNALAKADANYAKAVDSYTKAHDASVNAKLSLDSVTQAKNRAQGDYASAQAAFESTPATLPDGSTNPAKAQAEQKMKAAKDHLDELTREEEQAKQAYESAKNSEAEALNAKNEAYKNVTANKEAVDAAEAELNKAQEQLDTSKGNLCNALNELTESTELLSDKKAELASANGKIEILKQHNEDVQTLSQSIGKAKTRLAKLEKEEQDDWKKHDEKASKGITKNNERAGNIDGNVDTAKERRLSRKMERTNDNVEEHLEARDRNTNNVDLTFVMKQAPVHTDGSGTYRTGTNPLTGNTVYSRDGQLISEEEFKAATGAGM